MEGRQRNETCGDSRPGSSMSAEALRPWLGPQARGAEGREDRASSRRGPRAARGSGDVRRGSRRPPPGAAAAARPARLPSRPAGCARATGCASKSRSRARHRRARPSERRRSCPPRRSARPARGRRFRSAVETGAGRVRRLERSEERSCEPPLRRTEWRIAQVNVRSS